MSHTPLHTQFDIIAALREALRSRQLSAREVADSALQAVQAQSALNAFLHVDTDMTLAQADAADKLLAGDNAPGLAGIPIAHKDVFVTTGWRTTAASKIL